MPYQQPRTPIGQYKNRVTVFQTAMTDDGMGGQTGTPTQIARIWVQVVPLDRRRLDEVMAGEIAPLTTYHFSTRYRTNLLKNMYLNWRGRNLAIQSIVNDDQVKDRLVIFCAEVGINGT